MSKLFIKDFNKKRSEKLLELGRYKLGTMIRVITGHNALAYFKNKIDAEIDPTCRLCMEEDETFWHLATDCPVFIHERRECLLDKNIERDNWEVKDLLLLSEIPKIAMALEGYCEIWYGESESSQVIDSSQREPD
jgi:hypothetical protein